MLCCLLACRKESAVVEQPYIFGEMVPRGYVEINNGCLSDENIGK